MQEAIKVPIEQPSIGTRQIPRNVASLRTPSVLYYSKAKGALRLKVFHLLNAWCIWSGAARSFLWHIRLQSAKETPRVSLGAVPVLYLVGSLQDQPGTISRAASISYLLAIYPWLDIVHLRIFLMGFEAGEQTHGRCRGSETDRPGESPS